MSWDAESRGAELRGDRSSDAGTWAPPESFAEYRLVRRLGAGGMGEVYLAHDTLLDRPVAVKFLRGLGARGAARAQVLLEARAAARVQHPNVVTIHRVGEIGGRAYIVSELVRGRSLDRVAVPMPWRRALELGTALARGLAAAHRRGVLHLDIKPANAIISDEGEVKLVDFGLARVVERAGRGDEAGRADGEQEAGRAGKGAREATTLDAGDAGELRAASGGAAVAAAAGAAGAAGEPSGGESWPDFAGPAGAPIETLQTLPERAGTGGDTWRSAAAQEDGEGGWGEGRWPALDRESAEITLPVGSAGPVTGGTPLYLAPELWKGEGATRRADVYSLGALLYELCAGAAPHADAPLEELPFVARARQARPLAAAAPEVDPGFAAVVDRCLRLDPAERFASADELRDALEQLLARRAGAVPEGNPYRGLLAFEMEHRALFFGRSSEAGTVLERLRSEGFVLVAGDSGAGKSSLCRAGVLPLLLDGALADGRGRAWRAAIAVPGQRPVAAVAGALAAALGVAEAELAAAMRAAPGALVREAQARLGEGEGLVLFVDQLEELVTVSDPAEAAIAAEALGALALRAPGVRLLASIRGDFLARASALPGLGEEIGRALYFLGPMSPEKIREAIVGPARVKGVAFESEALVDQLVASTARAEGGLPLLQFALAELWDARPAPEAPLRVADLTAIGGVSGALARHADRVLARMPEAERAAARRLLGALVTAEGTRARRDEEELGAAGAGGTLDRATRAALEALVKGRLLRALEGERGTAYEIAHEALIREWSTLRRWLEEQAEGRAVRQRLAAAAAEWERLGRSRDALWSARQLREAAALDPGDLVGAREAAFLAASRGAIRRGRVWRGAVLAGLPLAAALAYGGTRVEAERALTARVEGELREARALHEQARRRERALAELRGEAFAAFDARSVEEGEQLWARSLPLAREVDHLYGQAGQRLEAALAFDQGHEEVRARLADVLYERAVAAEREGHAPLRDELLERMAMYDPGGARAGRWGEPARLTVASEPPGAEVRVARYVSDAEGRRRLADERALGATPTAEVRLERGSYLLTLSAPGRAPVRYPVLLGRGEAQRVEVPLPLRAEVPVGYAYIPPGRFLFGSSDPEVVRRAFLATVPLHEVRTEGYLIGLREVTFQGWMEYLQAIAAEAHARPASLVARKGAMSGSLELRPLEEGGWQLTLQPTTEALTARSGQPLVFPTRKIRAAQDWLRLPASGISLDDARGYAAWLDRTGSLPGARLCTEYEWERAARGADERLYPHGDLLGPEDADFDETYGKVGPSMGPDEVGSHPASRSPFGLDDMAGNIFEWTLSSLGEGAVLRGGAYFYDQTSARANNRTVVDGAYREPVIGLRVCASLPR